MRRYILLVGSALFFLLLASPVPLRALVLAPPGFSTASIPGGLLPINPRTRADLDRDGLEEDLILTAGRLTIASAGRTVWQSPSSWQVAQAAITDLNQDGIPEATLLVWRPFQPWPVDRWLPHGGRIDGFHDEAGDSCHIILVGWLGERWGEIWAGSALAEPVRAFAVADLEGDGVQDLLTLEGSYTDPRPSLAALSDQVAGRKIKAWDWNGFGFSVVSMIAGDFHKLALVRTGSGQILILVP